MHEYSLVQSLLNQVEQLRSDHNGVLVEVVTVEIGPLSGVEPQLITSAFEQLAPQQFSMMPRLEIRLVDLSIRCRACDVESSLTDISFKCPKCSSSRVKIISGDQFRLIDVRLQVHDSSCEAV